MSDPVQRLVDQLEIRELTARYNRAFDDGDAEAYAATFVPDGEMHATGVPNTVGRDALKELVRLTPYGIVHITTDPVIEIDGDRAIQRCTLIVANRHEDRSAVQFGTTGRYEDELVRTPDGWRFKKRVAVLDGDVAQQAAQEAAQ